jgi:hypothetical protein
MNRMLASAIAASWCATACVTPGPHVRVATATSADFDRVKDANEVWYEFQAGDVVPFHLLFFGALIGAPDKPLAMQAKKQFFLVTHKNMPMMISFDGRSYAGQHALQSIFTFGASKNDNTGQVAWMTYLGDSLDPQKELSELLKQAPATE